jgi:hypothetical protein
VQTDTLWPAPLTAGDLKEERLSVPQVADRFRAYHAGNVTWGSLHIVLDDGTVDNASVKFCIESARERADLEGENLGHILLRMSKTQRKKIARTC